MVTLTDVSRREFQTVSQATHDTSSRNLVLVVDHCRWCWQNAVDQVWLWGNENGIVQKPLRLMLSFTVEEQ